MKVILFKYLTVIALLAVLANKPPLTHAWEFATTTDNKIAFFNEDWQEVTSSAHKFKQISAIAFDEAKELIYFNDNQHQNCSIFSLKLPTSAEDCQSIEKMVLRTENEEIQGIAYDPLNRNLFWSDASHRKVYFKSVDAAPTMLPKVLVDLSSEESTPHGIAVDMCRRKLYWTNSNTNNANVERIGLDGKGREVIVNTNLYSPRGIVVDQLSDRIFWIDDKPGVHFALESANLDGSDRQIVVQGMNNVPLNLAVTKDSVYWTDQTHNAVWKYAKQATNSSESDSDTTTLKPLKVATFLDQVHGVIARNHFYSTMPKDQHCADVANKVMQRILEPKVTRSPVDKRVAQLQREYCLNDATYLPEHDLCICQLGYKGARCESSMCHNYCVHGTCEISAMGFPKCYCQDGFFGERCQLSKCRGYCLNGGECKVDSDSGDPSCKCSYDFGGERCEHNSTEICSLFCHILKHEPEISVPYGCHDICKDLALRTEDGNDVYAIPRYHHLDQCNASNVWTSYAIIALVSGVVMCLGLITLIVHGVRRIYKPARPRIKKTFVVRKQTRTNSSSDTPLTNRPLATEQCEITIENCCNMNICETPCFDPKLVEQTLSARDTKPHMKEDKKILIHNMEDALY